MEYIIELIAVLALGVGYLILRHGEGREIKHEEHDPFNPYWY